MKRLKNAGKAAQMTSPDLPLISAPFDSFTPDAYHAYVTGMYELRTKGKPKGPAAGLTVSRTKKGALSVRRSKSRAFEYVTMSEIAALAEHAKCSQADLWNIFKKKGYIVAGSRLEAEKIYADVKEIPW